MTIGDEKSKNQKYLQFVWGEENDLQKKKNQHTNFRGM